MSHLSFQDILRFSRLTGPKDLQLHRQRWTEQRLPLQRLQVQKEGETKRRVKEVKS